MRDVNRLKLVLVEQKKGGICDVDNIGEGTPANGYQKSWGLILPPFLNGVRTHLNQTLRLWLKSLNC